MSFDITWIAVIILSRTMNLQGKLFFLFKTTYDSPVMMTFTHIKWQNGNQNIYKTLQIANDTFHI